MKDHPDERRLSLKPSHFHVNEPLTKDQPSFKTTVASFLGWTLDKRDGNVHGSDMAHAMTASPKPSFRAPWRMGDTTVCKGNAG